MQCTRLCVHYITLSNIASSLCTHTKTHTQLSIIIITLVLIVYVRMYAHVFISGVVPAYSSLQCEFVCQPSHDSPDSALFRLVVDNGPQGADEENILMLKAQVCVGGCLYVCVRVWVCMYYTYSASVICKVFVMLKFSLSMCHLLYN